MSEGESSQSKIAQLLGGKTPAIKHKGFEEQTNCPASKEWRSCMQLDTSSENAL